ncbi:Mitochondrial import receptor subunit TOM40-1 [Zea mays]|uniref:Mitochondrial import receptor subunit TOM40-1 n=1 Tax=Zea mays TaxID=4577 RepID=A0A1D6PBI5_MAIZE|nr:Mitochondrial import receptor subunit TOM40-1 [Zea mays]
MGSVASAAAPPSPHSALPQEGAPPYGPGLAGILPQTSVGEEKKEEKVDYLNLLCPVPFEEIQREALTQGSETIKVPTAHYEFGANFLDPKLMLIGRVMTDGRLNARVKCDLTDNLMLKVNAQLTQEAHYSQGMFNFDYKGSDYRAQFQIGNNAFYGANYIQSVTPNLSMGTEMFWLGHQRKSGIGFACRYNTDKMVGTLQVASTGIVALSYVQKISEKVSLASDFMYNHMSRDVTSSFGYDYLLRQCRLRGKIDSNGVVAAYLEESYLSMGAMILCSSWM